MNNTMIRDEKCWWCDGHEKLGFHDVCWIEFKKWMNTSDVRA